MPSARHPILAWTGGLAILAGLLALIDTLWGALIVLGLGWDSPIAAVLAISFVLGLPAYLLDASIKWRVVIVLPSVILLRGFALSCIGSAATGVERWPPMLGQPLGSDELFSHLVHFCGESPSLGWQLRGTELLIAAACLLQWSKLRNRTAPQPH